VSETLWLGDVAPSGDHWIRCSGCGVTMRADWNKCVVCGVANRVAQPALTSSCRRCEGRIFYQDCPTGGWWIHEAHPDDDHDAAGPTVVEWWDES
jgi:DNA-directed RNA polymerase subunit RPC12/RpoP